MRVRRPLRVALCVALLTGVQRGDAADTLERGPAPLGRLPGDVRPTHYALELTVRPDAKRFSGMVRIQITLDRQQRVIWLHGADLDVSEAVLEAPGGERAARWEQVDRSGVVALTADQPIGPGPVTLRVRWTAAVDRQLRGLYRVDVGGARYAFTQFEPLLARRTFPCFDEPTFKTPFDLTLIVPHDAAALSNAPLAARERVSDELDRVRFATTDALPTYLLAFAVGPLDIVDAAPLAADALRARAVPFRIAAARGNGTRLVYAIANTPPLFQALETYFASPYPYPKLDIVAVPDMAWGGMENAGAIFFRESLLLLDQEQAPESQRRVFADVATHELAHQWFGDLVTMPWWNDLWLNEAFATWLAAHVLEEVHPEYEAQLELLGAVHGAMGADSLASARSIRQPIESPHDIENAFDDITYSKGAGVLAMFERWLGADAFRRGLQRYLQAHRFASATAADLLSALSEAAQRDVAAPFGTFLDQPGVPLIAVRVDCEHAPPRLELRQSRWLPVGSTAAAGGLWQVPVCVRFGNADPPQERCTLLAARDGWLELAPGGCPAWVMPNAAGAGYYRFTLPASDMALLTGAGWSRLSSRERLAVADSLAAGFAAASLRAADVLGMLDLLVRDPSRLIAVAPMPLVRFTREHVVPPDRQPRVERFAGGLYAPLAARLGWDARPDDSGETKLLRAEVIEFLATQARDPEVRRQLAARGRALAGTGPPTGLQLGGLAPELVDIGLAIAVEDGDAAFFDRVLAQLRATQDDYTRLRLVGALGATRDPVLAARARALAVGPDVRVGETMVLLRRQLDQEPTRAATWEWMQVNFDPLVAHLSERDAGELPWLASGFCETARADEVAAFFAPRIDSLAGGPRNLAGAVEAIRLCAARAAAQRDSAAAFFAEKGA